MVKPMETNIIKFNLRDRGRKHTGVERNYNIKAICDSINSPEVQESVGLRDVQGYYGHWPRLKFGLDASEGGVDGGKAVSLEPALVTTYIKAHLDGTIEHKAEFLDTATGNLAYKLFKQNVGGFSNVLSALDSVKPRWHGMDYVRNCNFIGNSFRGEVAALDDATGEPFTLDSIIQKSQDEFVAGYLELIAAGESREAALKIALDNAMDENTQLMSMLTSEQQQHALDDIHDFAVGTRIAVGRTQQIQSDMEYFRRSQLPQVDERKPVLKSPVATPNEEFMTSLFSR